MNDFEKLETELNGLYADYVLKYRILSYLEKELEGHFRNQREKVQVSENNPAKISFFVNTNRKYHDTICKRLTHK